MDRTRRIGPLTVGGAAIAASVIALAALSGRSPASAPAPTPPMAVALDPALAREYWTPERFEDARPLDLIRDASEAEDADPEPLRAAATPLKSTEVDHPARYPNRVHGKLYGRFPGVGPFACSATVVTSRSRSLITTAGHCVFDAGNTNRFATALVFVPGFSRGASPYGGWFVTNAITTRQWVRRGELAFDLALLRVAPRSSARLQDAVGSRGIGFAQPRHRRASVYGYPADGGRPRYDGYHLIRCDSGYVRDPAPHGGPPRSRGARCDQHQGSSGGGWVAQRSIVVGNISHYHPAFSNTKLFGPLYGSVARSLYAADRPGWPSIGPIRCRGQVVTIAGTNRRETIHGTRGRDVISTLAGDDKVKAAGGRDVICGGPNGDRIIGGGGKDRIDGGSGFDRCGGSNGNDTIRGCEVKRRPRSVG